MGRQQRSTTDGEEEPRPRSEVWWNVVIVLLWVIAIVLSVWVLQMTFTD